MLAKPEAPQIPLPKGWQGCVKSAVVHVISLAHYAIVYARAWAADSINARVRLAAENDRLHEECALSREELRIKDTRIAQITPQQRPHYGPLERMAILELRAARGWSLKQTAETFFLTSATIASRARWPRSAPCASPQAPVAGNCGARIRIGVRYHWGRKHLPIVALRSEVQSTCFGATRRRLHDCASLVPRCRRMC